MASVTDQHAVFVLKNSRKPQKIWGFGAGGGTRTHTDD